MKKNRILILSMIGLLTVALSCKDEFLEADPPGAYSEPSLQNAKGVEGMLIAAYSALDGSWFESWGNNRFGQAGGASNWVWGGITSDDSYKGTEPTDGLLGLVETFVAQPNNGDVNFKWGAIYDGIGKSNAVIRNIDVAPDMTESQATRVRGEARALRAHYHFEGVKVWGRVPYVDETVGIDIPFQEVQNPAVGQPFIWAQIEADLQYAYDNLPGTMPNAGRINKYAAGAMLAKVLMFQGKWSQAEPILDDIVNNGTNAAGTPLALMDKFYDVFRADMESSNTETMFAYEAAYGDGSISNGNYENTLNQPHGSSAPTSCCGFFQPSHNLANSYKVDGNGLPLLDTFNDTDLKTDEGIPAGDPFTPTTAALDARIDWTVGRRGIPFLDWGVNPGSTGGWVRDPVNGGPYNPVKTVPTLAEFDAQLAGVIDWGFTSSGKNVQIIRFADVLLLAAEVKAELNKLPEAVELVNRVRARAANPEGFVMLDGSPAANYSVGLYNSFGSQADALKAIRFERKIELGMEGHRFFDLVRWHKNSGASALPFDMVSYMNNDYLGVEATRRPHLTGVSFAEKNMYQPIPQSVISQSTVGGVENITQNPGY